MATVKIDDPLTGEIPTKDSQKATPKKTATKKTATKKTAAKKTATKTVTPAKGLLSPDLATAMNPPKLGNVQTAKGGIAGQQAYNEYNAKLNADLNRFNDVGPYGTSSWTQDPATGRWTRTTERDKTQGALQWGADTANWLAQSGTASLAPQIQDWYQKHGDYNLSGVSPLMNSGQLDAERKRVEDQLMNRFEERNAPIFEQQRRGLLQELADQGIPIESAQGQKRLQMLGQQQADARQGAMTSAVQFGGEELGSQFNRSLTGRQQGIAEYEQGRYAPITEFAQFKSLDTSGGGKMPEASPFTPINIQPPDVAGTGLGYATLDQQMKIAKMAGGGGGGEGGESFPSYDAYFNSQLPVPSSGGSNWGAQTVANSGAGFAGGLLQGAQGKSLPASMPATGFNPSQASATKQPTLAAPKTGVVRRFNTTGGRGLLNPTR